MPSLAPCPEENLHVKVDGPVSTLLGLSLDSKPSRRRLPPETGYRWRRQPSLPRLRAGDGWRFWIALQQTTNLQELVCLEPSTKTRRIRYFVCLSFKIPGRQVSCSLVGSLILKSDSSEHVTSTTRLRYDIAISRYYIADICYWRLPNSTNGDGHWCMLRRSVCVFVPSILAAVPPFKARRALQCF